MYLTTNEENIVSSDEEETVLLPAAGTKHSHSHLNVALTPSSYKRPAFSVEQVFKKETTPAQALLQDTEALTDEGKFFQKQKLITFLLTESGFIEKRMQHREVLPSARSKSVLIQHNGFTSGQRNHQKNSSWQAGLAHNGM